jgi:hypothetical protein
MAADQRQLRADKTRRMLDELAVARVTVERAVAARDALIRQAVAARIPRMDIMAATGLSRTRIYQIATAADTLQSSHN